MDTRPVRTAAAPALLVASVAKPRTAARKIDTIFAEELSGTATRETVPENVAAAEIS
ncbi:hypothetical protein [Amycolatopsis sp. NPDC051128]|uniref:hypothetical protein n=1 Tax=Amycolatopsis sp. NPDC051128 TaxID=3155412 RepID=UPI00343904D8